MAAIELYPGITFSIRLLGAIQRELAQHKQCDVAAALGVTEARVSVMLRGGSNLTMDSVARLLAAIERLNAKVKK